MASAAHRSEARLTPTRANFMILSFTAMIGLVALGYVGAAIAYLVPGKQAGSRPLSLGSVSADGITAADGTVYPFQSGVAGPFVYDTSGRGDVLGIFAVKDSSDPSKITLAIEQTCRHLGCPVAWTPVGSGGTFDCPCHGSIYAKNGDVIRGPAEYPLYRHNFYVKDGQLWVEGRQ